MLLGPPVALGGTSVVFGLGARRLAAERLLALGARRPLVVTDPHLVSLGFPDELRASLAAGGLAPGLYADVAIEPDPISIAAAAAAFRAGSHDSLVAVGGGSSIDTAKLVALLASDDRDLLAYVAAPVGRGEPPAGRLAPVVAVPTTTGSGSERSQAAVVDVPELGLKSAVSHPALVPAAALVDPELTLTLPPAVTAATGLDVAIHACEALTARPADERSGLSTAGYRGRNPFSDVWATEALRLSRRYLPQAVHDGADLEARSATMLAATIVGLGGAGVHVAHACSYPTSSLRHEFVAAGYPGAPRLVPHGFALGATAPAALELVAEAAPDGAARAAELLEAATIAEGIAALRASIGAPASLGELGYTVDDVPLLVRGAARQERNLAVAPRPIGDDDFERIFRASL